MSTVAEILRYLIHTATSVFLVAVLLRLLLQIVRADFYNPISQFVVRVTNPLLRPLRRVIPPVGRLDTASVVLAFIVECVAIVLVLVLLGHSFLNPLLLLAWSAIGIASLLVNCYFFAILAMIVASWIAPHSNHPALLLLHQLIGPVMAPIRRLLPPVGPIDFSPMLAFVAIVVAQKVLAGLASGAGLPAGLAPGY